MKLVHCISDQIRIEETIGGHRGDRLLTNRGEIPLPGTPHKLSLYHSDKFVCSISFACYENDVEKYRAEYIETLLKHFNETIQA